MSMKQELITILKQKDPSKLNMIVGFDGFVDEIIDVVDKRTDSNNFSRINTIKELAARIDRAANLSTNIELVPKIKKIGGNGPIMCNALSSHKSNITYLGALGYPTIDDVFSPMAERVSLISFANNGHTDALEFDDGKLMLGKMSSLNDVTYENLLNAIPKAELTSLLNDTNLLAMVNWSMLPYMTDLWEKLIKNVLPNLENKARHLFVDLADPEKREHSDIKEALKILTSFKTKFKVTLGLNKKEAYDIANILELFDSKKLENMDVELETLATKLYDYLHIDTLVVHPLERACCVMDGMYHEVMGPYTPKPKLTTGAGDNFNSGFMLGQLLNLKPQHALLTGVSTSGFYVREAHSPSFDELIHFIEEWDGNHI